MQIQESIECNVEGLLQTVLDTMNRLRYAENVACPKTTEIKRAAERYGVRTVYGNYNFISAVRNRSACLAVHIGSPKVFQRQLNQKQKEILKDAPKTVELVHEYVKRTPLVCVQRTMGDNRCFNPHCTLCICPTKRNDTPCSHGWASPFSLQERGTWTRALSSLPARVAGKGQTSSSLP